MKRISTFFVSLFITSSCLIGQNVGINSTGATPNTAAILDVEATNKGVLIPRVTDAERQLFNSPVAGLLIYNTTTNAVDLYNGTGWQQLFSSQISTSAATGTGTAGGIAINTNGGPPNPSAMLDISSSNKGLLLPRATTGITPITGLIIYNTGGGEFSYYNGSSWVSPCQTFIDNDQVAGTSPGGGIAINATGAAPDPSAMLDISSTSQGLLIPQISSPSTIPSPAQGLLVYNTTTQGIDYWTGSAWNELGTGITLLANAGPSTICPGGTSILTASGATTYSWSPSAGLSGTTGSSVTATCNTTSSYVVTGTTGGCSATQTVTVSVGSGDNNWIQLHPAGPSAPSARYNNQSAVWDPDKNLMYMFGGWAGSLQNDLWQFNPSPAPNGTWTLLSPTGTTPPAVQAAVSVWDPGNKVMYIFGGSISTGASNTLFKYDPNANQYTELSPSGPPPARNGAGALWSPANNVMYIFGGNDGGGTLFNDLWQFDPSPLPNGTWTELTFNGATGSPSQRYDMIYPIWNPLNNTMWVFGGGESGSESSDIWQYTPSSKIWLKITGLGTPPSGRDGAAVVLNPLTNVVYWFSGRCCNYTSEVDDFWQFDLNTLQWTQITPCGGTLPPERYSMAMVWNNASNAFYIMGGAGPGNLSDMWQYNP